MLTSKRVSGDVDVFKKGNEPSNRQQLLDLQDSLAVPHIIDDLRANILVVEDNMYSAYALTSIL